MTPQRTGLLRLLTASEERPSIARLHDQLRDQFPTTSPATIYNTLSLLKDLGAVLALGFSDGDNRYGGNRQYPYLHLICVRCRKLLDPEVNMSQDMAQQSGQRIVGRRLDSYGVYPDCRESEENSDQGTVVLAPCANRIPVASNPWQLLEPRREVDYR